MKDLRKTEAPIIEIASDDKYEYTPMEVIGDTVYFFTNYKAPKYCLMKASIDNPKIKNWISFVPETENVLNSAGFTNGQMILTYQKDASIHAYVYSAEGKLKHEIQLPTLGSAGFSFDKKEKDIFYTFTSFIFPSTIYKYDIINNKSEIFVSPKVQFNPTDYVTEQVFYSSKDGTKIPMFLTYKKRIEIDGSNPVFLYGYGGFNISLNPSFSAMRIPFLENGGIYAQVNLRGGGEYGEAWHLAGTKMQKQNVFDDFIAAAEYLIAHKYTNKQKIAIVGGSNGGLLVGACVNQRPDLFKVAIPEVGVMDMLRYQKFTIGYNWASDYGTSDDSKEMFDYLYKYSPIHNIKNDGVPYPAILITTADHDDRVVPAHSFKYAATLQAANTGTAPKLIRIDTKAGHGGGKPITKAIEEQADIYSFIMYNLGMKIK
jgi:prolyl oligopeptidase